MALESATYISDLNSSNPAASDAISTADDHLRLIKSTIKATFPNIDGPVTLAQDEFAPLASPTFTGTPAAPTASAGTNTTQVATTAFVKTAVDTAADSLGTMSIQDADDVAITGGTLAGNGSGLTSLNASNLSTGIVGTERLGSGTASSSTYLRGDQTWSTLPTGITTTTGSPLYYGARAWVNFNGTGTVAIRSSVNVSSITDNGTGYYTINFTTAMPDANYSIVGTTVGYSTSDTGGNSVQIAPGATPNTTVANYSTGSCAITTGRNGTIVDMLYVCCAVFR